MQDTTRTAGRPIAAISGNPSSQDGRARELDISVYFFKKNIRQCTCCVMAVCSMAKITSTTAANGASPVS